jgi:glycosyltransferase involved in cell wall biosynthesis
VNRAPVSLSIVIPAYNEATRLPATLSRLTTYLERQPWDWEIRVVDDGSSDGTADVAAQASISEPRIVAQREPHRGKGGAVRAGLLAARGAYRFMCDADLSMPPEELPRFLPPVLDGFDVAIGSREGQGARRVGEPWRRHVIGRVFNRVIQLLVIRGIEDTQCGFKMFTAEAAERIFPRTTLDGWAFDVEVLGLARVMKLRIVEVPIEWHHRGESQVSPVRDGLAMFADLLRIRARLRRVAPGEARRPTSPS